jgi:HEAT repeats
MTILLAALLCAPASATGSQPASSQNDGQIRQRIDTYLGSIDAPIRPAQWRALGPRGAAILEQIAQDSRVLPTRRAKALDGLSAIGSPTAADTMLSLAKSEQNPLVVRLSAVRAASRTLPADQVAPALQPILQGAQDGHVRAVAADMLSSHGGCTLVRAQAAREDNPSRMRRALQRCGR